jgi:iron(III) transport system substrate-binding protein
MFQKGLCVVASVILAGSALMAKESLTVYTALESDQVKPYLESFKKAQPDIEVKIVRDSTGIITAKLLAEKANPQADVVWGTAATSLVLLEQNDMLQPYAPASLNKIESQFRDSKNPPTWVGDDVWGSAICFNEVEAKKQNLPLPTSWEDLTKPIYKGKIVMPNPASSGTGFLDVTAWLKIFGEKKGWEYMDKLHENIGQYTHSGSKPCKMAAAGEFPIGISFEYRAAKSKKEGAPIAIVYPKEGLGWDLEATAIMKGTKNLEPAKKFVDWATGEEANKLYAENFAVVAYKGLSQKIENIPENYASMLIKNDFAWAAKNRESILTEWSKRYESKSEPKK